MTEPRETVPNDSIGPPPQCWAVRRARMPWARARRPTWSHPRRRCASEAPPRSRVAHDARHSPAETENKGTPLFRGGKRPTLGTRSGARAPLPWSPSPRPRADLSSSPRFPRRRARYASATRPRQRASRARRRTTRAASASKRTSRARSRNPSARFANATQRVGVCAPGTRRARGRTGALLAPSRTRTSPRD